MKRSIYRAIFVCVFALVFAIGANAQNPASASKQSNSGSSVAAIPAKVVVVVVGSAAKGAWVTTKFTAKHIVKPVAKTIFLKVAPKVGAFVVKETAKRALPMAVKLALL